jgi:valyl-tRNA synthetase
MVLAGLYNLGDVPFSDVFIHANILDGKGERMSKSKGNGIDPVDIIECYGTDAMRYVLCDMQTGTQDIRLPVTAICSRCQHHNDLAATAHGKSVFTYVCGKLLSGKAGNTGCGAEFDVLGTMGDLPQAKLVSERFDIGRQVCNKLWNSARFALMNLEGLSGPGKALRLDQLVLEDRWILDRLNETIAAVSRGLAGYNPSEALTAVRDFFWSSLCDWYLELIKSRMQNAADASGETARRVLAYCMDQVLRLFHPFIPFITEHLWQVLNEHVPERSLGTFAAAPRNDTLACALWPAWNELLEAKELRLAFADAQEITRAVREVRAAASVPPRDRITITVKASDQHLRLITPIQHVIERLALVTMEVDPGAERRPGSAVKMVGELEIFVHGVIDDGEERGRLVAQLSKVEQEIAACEKKLGNRSFVERAPEDVVIEQRERLISYRANKEALERSLRLLG